MNAVLLLFALVPSASASVAGIQDMLADDVDLAGARRLADSFPMNTDPEGTVAGCTCIGACSATYTHDSASCDWCWTGQQCGNSALRGYWDYCVYPKMELYEQQTFKQKEDELWSDLTAPGVVGKCGPIVESKLGLVHGIVAESMITTFDDQWDVLPQGRTKVIHSQGAHCKVDLDVSSQSFTGLFAAGKAQGIIRLGSASSVNLGKIQPGFALKFLRSGRQSANFVALTDDAVSDNFNFWHRKFSNQVAPDSKLQALGKFQQASDCIDQVGLSDVCQYGHNGIDVGTAETIFPYEIVFEPSSSVVPTTSSTQEGLMKELALIPEGSQLFDVYTYSSPTAKKEGKKEVLGTLTTTTQCMLSVFGDTRLFFKHQRMEEDFAKKPEWIPAATHAECKANNRPISEWQCGHARRQKQAVEVV